MHKQDVMRTLSTQTGSRFRSIYPWIATCVAAALPLLSPRPVQGCGGPCAVPELWSLQPTSQGLNVVTNFGLVGRDEDGWVLACEEHIGGILLDVKASGDWLVALTDSGVWLSYKGVCAWQPGPTSATSSWFFDSALGLAKQDAPPLLVLAPNAKEQHTNLERSNGDVFEVVRSFDSSVAFRNLVASPEFDYIFVTGYSQGPRTWHLSFSRDAGATWSDLVPSEVDNMGAVMVPKRVDPNNPAHLFLAAQTPSGGGDQVWLFDAKSTELHQLAALEDNEVLSNIAFIDNEVWVAGRRNGGGSLYRASADSLTFTRVRSDAPSLACLDTMGSTLLTCANDYSYESSFLVAEVKGDSAILVPSMRVADLVNLRACSDACAATQEWLTTTYGSAKPFPDATDTQPDDSMNTPTSDEPTSGDSTLPQQTTDEATTKPSEETKSQRSSSGGCFIISNTRQNQWTPFALLALALMSASRRAKGKRLERF